MVDVRTLMVTATLVTFNVASFHDADSACSHLYIVCKMYEMLDAATEP